MTLFNFMPAKTVNTPPLPTDDTLVAQYKEALRKGTIDDIHSLMVKGLDPHARDEKGYGLIHLATLKANAGNEENMLAVIKLLTDFGADVNAYYLKDQYGALTTATRRKLPKIVSYLLQQGADTTLAIVNHHKTTIDYAREFTDERGQAVLACFEKAGYNVKAPKL